MSGLGQNRALECHWDASGRNLIYLIASERAKHIVAVNADLAR